MAGIWIIEFAIARMRSSQLFPWSKNVLQFGKYPINLQKMSTSKRNARASSDQFKISICMGDDSAERVACRMTEARAKRTQTHFVRSYHTLILVLLDICLEGRSPYSSSCSSRIGPRLCRRQYV